MSFSISPFSKSMSGSVGNASGSYSSCASRSSQPSSSLSSTARKISSRLPFRKMPSTDIGPLFSKPVSSCPSCTRYSKNSYVLSDRFRRSLTSRPFARISSTDTLQRSSFSDTLRKIMRPPLFLYVSLFYYLSYAIQSHSSI